MKTLTITARAKLNLFLDITGTRSDGYHTISTVMQSVSLSDVVLLSADEGSGISVLCDNPLIPAGESNTAHKAARMFLEETGLGAKIEIQLQKRIPSGAGLGGASADAAAVLAGLNSAFGAPLDARAMNALAAKVGADVPFCLTGGTKLCEGIGDVISDTAPIKDRAFLIVMPDFTVSTAQAYKKYDELPKTAGSKPAAEDFIGSITEGAFAEHMYNIFEELFGEDHVSAIKDIKRRLLENSAEGALLTGSGAAVFGVFSDIGKAARAAKAFPIYFTAVCEPVERGIHIC